MIPSLLPITVNFFFLKIVFMFSSFQHHGQLSPSESGILADKETMENLFYYLLHHTLCSAPLLPLPFPVLLPFMMC